MFYIVGLGNPGEMYTNTRHNVGWMVLTDVQERNGLPGFVDKRSIGGRISEGVLFGTDVFLLLPTTYMNKSGASIKKVVTNAEEAKRLIVIYDDVDIPIGEMKISFGRGSGGHNGITSIINALGTKDFVRIRIGVAGRGFFGTVKRPKGDRLSKHVLGAFKKSELGQLKEVSDTVANALKTILTEGVEKAMNQYN